VQATERRAELFPWLSRGAIEPPRTHERRVSCLVPRAKDRGDTLGRAYKKNDQAFVEQQDRRVAGKRPEVARVGGFDLT